MWNKSPISGRPKQEKTKQEILENILEDNYDLNIQFHKSMRESIYCFSTAIYDEKLPFKEWEKKHYGNYIEQPKQETHSQETIEQIVNSLSKKDATNLDLFLKGMQHQKEQDNDKYNAKEVELVAFAMVNWALDNIGNTNPESGKKFDEVLAKYKNK